MGSPMTIMALYKEESFLIPSILSFSHFAQGVDGFSHFVVNQLFHGPNLSLSPSLFPKIIFGVVMTCPSSCFLFFPNIGIVVNCNILSYGYNLITFCPVFVFIHVFLCVIS